MTNIIELVDNLSNYALAHFSEKEHVGSSLLLCMTNEVEKYRPSFFRGAEVCKLGLYSQK